MRIMVMFDLPMETSKERRNYRKFRKELLNEGFLMMQYSIYVKVCNSRESASFTESRLKRFIPKIGLIQTMMVTEKQYNDMHFLIGERSSDLRNSADRTLVI